jgi:hypothetical protein
MPLAANIRSALRADLLVGGTKVYVPVADAPKFADYSFPQLDAGVGYFSAVHLRGVPAV